MGGKRKGAISRLGPSRFRVTFPKSVPALNRPLRAAELEAMTRALRTRPDDQAPAVLDSCLSGLAMRAPLLCAMFRRR
jgi:hypothetical protein